MPEVIKQAIRDNEQSSKYKYWPLAAMVLVAAAVLATPFAIDFLQVRLYKDSTGNGEFGDQFGFVNALFSGLAFAILIIALWMQREELQAQRSAILIQIDEFKNQVEEMKATKQVLADQTRSMRLQNFENTFFQLFKVFTESQERYKQPIDDYVQSINHRCEQMCSFLNNPDREIRNAETQRMKQNYDLMKTAGLDLRFNPAEGRMTAYDEETLRAISGHYYNLSRYAIKRDIGPFLRLLTASLRHVSSHENALAGEDFDPKQYSDVLFSSLNPVQMRMLSLLCDDTSLGELRELCRKYEYYLYFAHSHHYETYVYTDSYKDTLLPSYTP
mgnify:CR=1 FL=1